MTSIATKSKTRASYVVTGPEGETIMSDCTSNHRHSSRAKATACGISTLSTLDAFATIVPMSQYHIEASYATKGRRHTATYSIVALDEGVQLSLPF